MGLSITSSNSSFSIAILPLYPAPQTLQGYAVDDAFTMEGVTIGETMLGVDGIFTAGYIPYVVPMNIMLNAASSSMGIFEFWAASEQVAQEKFFATGLITYPSIGRKYTLSQGVLMKYSPIPDSKKVLQPRAFGITWGSVTAATI